MSDEDRATLASRESQWRWPRERESAPSEEDRETPRAAISFSLPDRVIDNADLRRTVIANPDDDGPRRAYAAWMAGQDHELARAIGAFITAQLRVADAFRANLLADVTALRNWRGEPAFVSTTEFRAGDSLRPWLIDDLNSLIACGRVGWPQVYRGFIERVSMRARRFLRISQELFSLAPIRHLVLIGVPEVVNELAECPHLARIRSLSLTWYSPGDELTDEVLLKLLASPHLANLVHLRLVHQPRLTPRAYEDVVTAPTLPLLSSFEVFTVRHSWDPDPALFDPRGRTDRIYTFDTAIPVMRSTDWIPALERAVGYEPCLHPEDHYRGDIEAVVARPIALDGSIMWRRGLSVSGLPVAKERPQ